MPGHLLQKPLACGLLGRAMAAQELGQVLGKRGARQDHVASHFVRLLLQVSLDVGKKTDDGRSLFQLGLQLGNQGQGLGVGIVHVEDDQRRLLFAILFHVIEQIFFGFAKFYFYVQLARSLLNLSREKKVIHEGRVAHISAGKYNLLI
jgi:hypothetical protein